MCFCLFPLCTAVQNILVNRHCQCRDIFLCPHDGDSGYGVFISDFDSALQVERGREKLERTKLHGRPIKYRVYGTDGYRPPEVGEGMFLLSALVSVCMCTVHCITIPYALLHWVHIQASYL